jgi:PrtD family type I secretion system ABC transporter
MRRAGRFLEESVRNAEVVRGLGLNAAVKARWQQVNDCGLREQLAAGSVGGAFSGLTKFSRQFLQMAMLGLGAYLVLDQHLTPGVMMAATILLGRALAPVESLVAGWRSLEAARTAWKRLDSLLQGDGVLPIELPAPAGQLEVERVVFGHRGAERPTLRGVSFSLAAGEAVGIVGPSAAGKSTLARLLIGIYKPSAGVVRLDGTDIAAWPRERLGPFIGYLPQDMELFAGTVAQNIARLGEPEPMEVIRAAQLANVHELILRLPNGYDTEVGEGGLLLSAGQRQRIGLARALYKQTKLVMLDEPNSNLDHEGHQALVDTLRKLKEQGVTVVIIAHRPSLLTGVDKLLVLRDGMVEMQGPRAEVIARLARPPARDAA